MGKIRINIQVIFRLRITLIFTNFGKISPRASPPVEDVALALIHSELTASAIGGAIGEMLFNKKKLIKNRI
jgi:hypothetical protein